MKKVSFPYEVSLENRDVAAEFHRLHNQAHLNWEKEARNLGLFGLRDGMDVLEVGSGPGFITELLSGLVPSGSITCVEIETRFIEHAREYLKERAQCPVRIVQQSLTQMEFGDGSFDFALARLVIEHLPDPVGALREIRRVLKPGGTLVITDFDFGIPPLSHPEVPEADLIREKSRQVQLSLGAHPTAGRRLWHMLKAAGFEGLDMEAVVFHSGEKGVEWCYPQFDPVRLMPMVKNNLITEDEMEQFRQSIERFVSAEDAFYMRVILMVGGKKP